MLNYTKTGNKDFGENLYASPRTVPDHKRQRRRINMSIYWSKWQKIRRSCKYHSEFSFFQYFLSPFLPFPSANRNSQQLRKISADELRFNDLDLDFPLFTVKLNPNLETYLLFMLFWCPHFTFFLTRMVFMAREVMVESELHCSSCHLSSKGLAYPLFCKVCLHFSGDDSILSENKMKQATPKQTPWLTLWNFWINFLIKSLYCACFSFHSFRKNTCFCELVIPLLMNCDCE